MRKRAHQKIRELRTDPRGLGDTIEAAVKPVARALKLRCLDEKEKLKPNSPCARKRDFLNKHFPYAS